MTATKVGKIILVGFGPGSTSQMTYRARQAIEEAEVVIGYATYIKLMADLLEGKTVIRSGMTEEIDRCLEAYEQAQAGKIVALISSGDIGVYGMAGPSYEALFKLGWTPASDIKVELVLGTTALNAAASLVGAPLTHDFCAISLSDQLTPWPQIARRLRGAAEGNFVVALYNPKSGRRAQHIREAARILLMHRAPTTPVAIVKSAYRELESIQKTTLGQMSDCEIGMLCTVLIGNDQTAWREGLMITPRGYHNKYDLLTGETQGGERAGRPLSDGLDGWPHMLCAHLAQRRTNHVEAAARYFDMALGEALLALSDGATTNSEASISRKQTRTLAEELLGFSLRKGTLVEFSEYCRTLPVMDLGVALSSPSTVTLRATQNDLRLSDGGFSVHSETAQLGFRFSPGQSVYMASRGGKPLFAYLVDEDNTGLLRVAPSEDTPTQRDAPYPPLSQEPPL